MIVVLLTRGFFYVANMWINVYAIKRRLWCMRINVYAVHMIQ